MPVAQFKISQKAAKPASPVSPPPARPSSEEIEKQPINSPKKTNEKQFRAPVQQSLSSAGSVESGPTAVAESGFPDPFKILADARKVIITKELSGTAKCLNCLFSMCGVTRYRYYVKDATTGKDLFKAKMSYSASCNLCAGATRHNYSLDLYLLPLDGSKFLRDKARKGLFMSTSSSEKSKISAGGHGVTDMRNLDLVGRIIPSPSGSLTVKDGAHSTAFRIAVPVSSGFASNSSEMIIEDGSTTALVGRLSKQWGRSDTDIHFLCCCCGSGREHGPFTLDMSAVSNVKKRALLILAGIIADAVSFEFRAAAPVVVKEIDEDDKPLIN